MALRGKSSTMNTRFGILNLARRPSSAFNTEASLTMASLLQTTTAVTPSPKSACGTPITADSITPGMASISLSISFGYTLKPPEITRSLPRPRMCTYPRLSILPRSPVMKKPCVEGRHAHQHGRARHQLDDQVRIEFRQEDHRGAREQRHVARHEQPVGVIDRQRVDQYVVLGEAPGVDQRQRIRREVIMRP